MADDSDIPPSYVPDDVSSTMTSGIPKGYVPDEAPPLPGYVPDHKFSAGSADDIQPSSPPPSQLASTAQLSPDQLRQYGQNVQTTPLNPNPVQQSLGEQIGRSSLGHLFSGTAAFLAQQYANGINGMSDVNTPMKISGVAQDARDYGQNVQPGVASGVTGMGTGMATIAGGPVTIASSALNNTLGKLFDAQSAEANGGQVDDHAVLKAVAEGGVEAGFNLLMQSGITGDAAKAVIGRLAPYIGQLPATVGSRLAIGAGVNAIQNEVQNRIAGNPFGTGSAQAAAQGGLMEAGAGGLHDIKSAFTPAAPSPQATPAAEPSATQAETSPQNTGTASDEHPAVKAQQQLVDLRGQLQRGELQGDEKVAAEQKVDSLAAEVQGHIGNDEDLYDKVAGVQETPKATGPEADIDQMTTETQKALDEDQAKIKQNRTLIDSLKGNPLAETTEETPVTTEEPKKSVFAGVISDESGGAKVPEAVKTFANESVAPEIEKVKKSAVASWENVNRYLGTGMGENEATHGLGNDLRTSWAQQDLDRLRTEQQYAPYREKMASLPEAEKTQWLQDFEDQKPSHIPELQPLADLHQKINAEDVKGLKEQGIDTSKYNTDNNYVERMAEWPDSPKGNGGGSIAGAENHLKGREFDTYTDFKKAVEDSGGKMKYDNPVDAMIAKHMEIQKGIEGRKIINQGLDAGSITRLPAGESMPEGKSEINDPIARKMSKNQMWIDPDTGKAQMRPAPRMIADTGFAEKINQLSSPGIGKSLPILKQVAQVKRAATAMNFAVSAIHIPLEAVGNGAIRFGKAIENIFHGEPLRALQNIRSGLPGGSLLEGKALRQQARNASFDPSLEPVVQASVQGGAKFDKRSVLQPGPWARGGEQIKEGNPIAGVANRLGAVFNAPNTAIMDHYVPAIKAGAMGAWASDLIRRGLPPEQLHEQLQKANQNVENILGQVDRQGQFQNKLVTDALDTVFPAPKFSEGALRYGGALARDSVSAINDMVHGKSPTITPAMYTFGGLLAYVGGMGALTQMAYSTATTGKPILPSSPKDLFYPRTGRKNADGSDERISLPNPMSLFTSIKNEGVSKALANRVSPFWRAFMDVIDNSDYRGVQVHAPDSMISMDSAKHIGKSLLPFSVNNMVEQSTGDLPTDLKVAGFLGVRKAPTAAMHSDAENQMYDLMPHMPRTQAQAARSDAIRSLTNEFQTKGSDVAGPDIRAAVAAGTISGLDTNKITGKEGSETFAQRLKASSLSAPDVMRVWDKATPEEKSQLAWVARSKVNQSKLLSDSDRTAYLTKIRTDLQSKE